MPEDDDVKGKVVRLMAGARPEKKRSRKREPAGQRQRIEGNNNIQAGRDMHIKTERIITRPRVTVVPGYLTITAAQKARLLDLKNRWVDTNNAVRRTKLSYAAAQSAINRRAGVNSYHEIRIERFAEIEAYILRQIAIVNRMPSAHVRSPSWRTARIRAIQARCGEKFIQEWRRRFMAERFGKTSMTDIDDAELEVLYRAVMAR